MRMHAALKWTAVAATLTLALSPGVVLASGFQLVEQNASGLGNAFSGQAAGVKDASAIYFNPAALTGLEGGNVVLSIEPIIPSYSFNDAGSTTPSLPPGLPPLEELSEESPEQIQPGHRSPILENTTGFLAFV